MLINASALLSGLGRPSDALALLDRAQQLASPHGTPLGIPERAVELNNRGLALLGMGRYAAAAGALSAAVRLGGPTLSEAEVNLAQALHCQNKRQAAFHALLAGSYRRRYDLVVTPPIEAPSAAELGLGSPGGASNTLPTLTYPPTPADASAANADFEAIDQRDGQQDGQLASQITTLFAQLTTELQHASLITQRRTGNLLRLAVGYGGPTAGPIMLPAQVEAARKAEHDYTNQEFGQDGEITQVLQQCDALSGSAVRACLHDQCAPKLDDAHSNWLALMEALDNAARKAALAEGQTAAPALANLTDPAHQLAEDYILHSDLVLTSLLTGEAENWDALAGQTYGDPTTGLICDNISPTGAFGASGGVGGGPGPCSDAAAAHKLVLELEIVELKLSCQSVEAVVESPGLIGAFGSLEYNFYGKTVTAFVGVKAGGSGIPAEVQGGIFVKAGADGIQDIGARGSLSENTGFIEHEVSKDFISLAGAIAPTPLPTAAQ